MRYLCDWSSRDGRWDVPAAVGLAGPPGAGRRADVAGEGSAGGTGRHGVKRRHADLPAAGEGESQMRMRPGLEAEEGSEAEHTELQPGTSRQLAPQDLSQRPPSREPSPRKTLRESSPSPHKTPRGEGSPLRTPREPSPRPTPQELRPRPTPRELGPRLSSMPRELGARATPRELGPRPTPRELGPRPTPRELGPRATPRGEGQASTSGGAPYTEVVQVPAQMVGKLIGKGGETIKQLQYSTGAKVQIDHFSPGPTKHVSVSALTAGAVEAAKAAIAAVVADEGPAGEATETVECPQGIVGRVIGRQGETIRALQQASQAHILVEQNFPEGHPRRVKITGKAEAVERARRMVTELIEGQPGNAQAIIQKYGAGVRREVACPRDKVGRVIGKGGETIKGLQRACGANIQIDQAPDPMVVSISGQPAAVEQAAAAIADIISTGAGPPSGEASTSGGGAFPGHARAPSGPFAGFPHFPPLGAYPSFPGAAPAYAYNAFGGFGPPFGAFGGFGGLDPFAAAGRFGAFPQGGTGVWREVYHEGRRFWYNAQTGASQWEKPPNL